MTIPEGFTQDQWDSLTDAEREGILSEDGQEEAQEENEEEQERKQQQDEADRAAKAQAEADAAAAKKDGAGKPQSELTEEEKAAAAAAAAQPSKEQSEPVARRPRGIVEATLPEDFDAKVKANEEAMDANVKAYEDGDISFSEYQKKQRQLDRESRDLDRIKDRAELASESSQQLMLENWRTNMDAFLVQHPELAASAPKQAAFDHFLKVVTEPVLKENGMPGVREINKAYTMWCEEYGIEPTTGKADPKPRKEQKVPPTLGNLPSSDVNDTQDGRWAVLDRLADNDPLKFEAELAKLSEADRDAYMQAS